MSDRPVDFGRHRFVVPEWWPRVRQEAQRLSPLMQQIYTDRGEEHRSGGFMLIMAPVNKKYDRVKIGTPPENRAARFQLHVLVQANSIVENDTKAHNSFTLSATSGGAFRFGNYVYSFNGWSTAGNIAFMLTALERGEHIGEMGIERIIRHHKNPVQPKIQDQIRQFMSQLRAAT